MRVCTAAQMAAIDKETIAGGIDSLELMERAGEGMTDILLDFLASADGGHDHEVVSDTLVVDDRHRLEVVVAKDVVDVVLGVDDVADGAVRLGLLAHGHGLGRQLWRVDDHDAVGGDDEAGVAATDLRIGEDVGGDLLHGRVHGWLSS